MPFPEILKELREKRGFTQEQLAAILNLTKNAISHYEKNTQIAIASCNSFQKGNKSK